MRGRTRRAARGNRRLVYQIASAPLSDGLRRKDAPYARARLDNSLQRPLHVGLLRIHDVRRHDRCAAAYNV